MQKNDPRKHNGETKPESNIKKKPKTFLRKLKKGLNQMVESWYFIGLTTVVTIWALFSDDIRQLATDASKD